MADTHEIIYIVCGVIGAIAIVVLVVTSCLICKERRLKKSRKVKKDSKQAMYDKNHKKSKHPRATHPEFRKTTEKVQPTTDRPTTDTETLSKPKIVEPRPKSSMGFTKHSRHRSDGRGPYQAIQDDTSQDESDGGSSILSTIVGAKTSIKSETLLAIPFISGRHSSCSGTSISEDEGKLTKEPMTSKIQEQLGSITISLYYDFQDLSLVLKILRATELAAKDMGGTSDPYVIIRLLPDKKHKLETKVKHKCLNPVWNETFMFEKFPYDKLKTRTIHLEVLDKDRITADDPIGEVFVPLVEMNLSAHRPNDELELRLLPVDADKYRLGEIQVALTYDPNKDKLSLTIQKCRDLKAKDITTNSSDPFVKIWLLRRGERVAKNKTAILRRELNPVFNQTFHYQVPLAQMRETQLQITVRDYDTIGINETIGSIVLGALATGPTESRHWVEMMSKPRIPVSAWHALTKAKDR